MYGFESPVLKVKNLRKQYGNGCSACKDPKESPLEKNYCRACGTIYACQDISFEVFPGEILGIVGESGSGKSTMMSCLYFQQDATEGEVYLKAYEEGKSNIMKESSQQKRYIKNHILGMVYQNPIMGLRMDFSAMGNIAEKLIAAGDRRVEKMEARGQDLLQHVNIPLFRRKEMPKNFSGGMQQRVQIAKALSNNPEVLLLDEITTGLDLSVQANVLDLIKKLQREMGISMIVVSHDLAVIRMLADRTLVMLNGKVVEEGLTDQVLEDPQHAYTQQLVQALL